MSSPNKKRGSKARRRTIKDERGEPRVKRKGQGLGTRFANQFRKLGPGEEPVIIEFHGELIKPPEFD